MYLLTLWAKQHTPEDPAWIVRYAIIYIFSQFIYFILKHFFSQKVRFPANKTLRKHANVK